MVSYRNGRMGFRTWLAWPQGWLISTILCGMKISSKCGISIFCLPPKYQWIHLDTNKQTKAVNLYFLWGNLIWQYKSLSFKIPFDLKFISENSTWGNNQWSMQRVSYFHIHQSAAYNFFFKKRENKMANNRRITK